MARLGGSDGEDASADALSKVQSMGRVGAEKAQGLKEAEMDRYGVGCRVVRHAEPVRKGDGNFRLRAATGLPPACSVSALTNWLHERT